MDSRQLFGSLTLLIVALVRWSYGWTEEDVDAVMGRVHQSAIRRGKGFKLDHIQSIIDTQLAPEGYFKDLKYGQDGMRAFREHAKRMGSMAYYHAQNGIDFTAEIMAAFQYISREDTPPINDSNWWTHVIGVPSSMWPAVVLARDLLPAELLNKFLDRYWLNTAFEPVWPGVNQTLHGDSMSGGNLAPRAFMAEVEGLLRGTHKARHIEVQEKVYQDLVLMHNYIGNGLRPDFCLHQHNVLTNKFGNSYGLEKPLSMMYNGEYGKELLRWNSEMMTWFEGTSAGVPFRNETEEAIFHAFLGCEQWLFRGQTFEPTSCGRKIVGGSSVSKWAARSGVWDTSSHLTRLGRYGSQLESVRHRFTNTLPQPHHALTGNKYFFSSDLMAQQRREYMATVRMLSRRTSRPESWPSQNQRGYFQGDGFLAVVVDGGEWGSPGREVFQHYDWARVPGITNLYTDHIPQFKTAPVNLASAFNNASFVGGVSNGMVGVASMDLARPTEPLRALKSWFFFDDVIVAVGTGIYLKQDNANTNDVITTLTQAAYDDSKSFVVGTDRGRIEMSGPDIDTQEVSPYWLHHRNIGYVFLNADETLRITTSSSHNDIFTAWLVHGPSPSDASYAYAILPAADQHKTRNFAEKPTVKVIAKEPTIHAVCHTYFTQDTLIPTQVLGVAFKKAGEVTAACSQDTTIRLEVDTPCLALVTVGKEVEVTLADPTQTDLKDLQFTVGVNGSKMSHTVELPRGDRRGTSITLKINM